MQHSEGTNGNIKAGIRERQVFRVALSECDVWIILASRNDHAVRKIDTHDTGTSRASGARQMPRAGADVEEVAPRQILLQSVQERTDRLPGDRREVIIVCGSPAQPARMFQVLERRLCHGCPQRSLMALKCLSATARLPPGCTRSHGRTTPTICPFRSLLALNRHPTRSEPRQFSREQRT